jgi:hypothetical protein
MSTLPNGTVMPFGLLKQDTESQVAGFNKSYKNFPLRAGIVVASYPPENDRNFNKITIEYDVLVIEQDENRGITPITYKNCISSDGAGSIADYFERRLRTQKKKRDKKKGEDFAGHDGAIVLLLCLDGSSEKGIIVGCLSHPDRKSKLKGQEQVLAGEYNGMSILVNDDGSANLTFKGATNHDGTPKDNEQGNTTIDIEKDGSLQFKNKGVTQRNEKGGNYLLATEGSQTITAKKAVSLTTEESYSVSAKADATLMTQAAMILQAQGSATLRAQSVEVASDTTITLKGQQISIESASVATVRGSQITVEGLVFLGSAGGLPALLPTTKYLGIGNLGAPVISSAIGPFATKVYLT